MGREFELKFRANRDIIDKIQKKFPGFSTIQMETAYYDTPSRDLSAHRWTLRRRMENGVSVCTLKTPLGDGSRGEWEVLRDTIEDGVLELCKLPVPDELPSLVKDGLVQTCAARFTRLAKTIVLENATVELALDEGCLLGAGKTLPFAEVEVELKVGSEETAVAFAEKLVREFGLVPEPKSKQRRALELLG